MIYRQCISLLLIDFILYMILGKSSNYQESYLWCNYNIIILGVICECTGYDIGCHL